MVRPVCRVEPAASHRELEPAFEGSYVSIVGGTTLADTGKDGEDGFTKGARLRQQLTGASWMHGGRAAQAELVAARDQAELASP
jgi:hypothetical protein